MAIAIEALAPTGQWSQELAALAERVRASVVVVRGTREGAGSGVVWSEQGLVVTNAHVVASAQAQVILGDGSRWPAEVVARAPEDDLAALQIVGTRPAGLVPASIGESGRLRPGELVLAVGNPLGERNAATLGMFSGAGAVGVNGRARPVLRLAITLRPGNSGGALVNVRGEVVGIPHMVVGPGLALAVPSQAVRQLLTV